MSFTDLEFRWHQEYFELFDLEFTTTADLLELDENEEWFSRAPRLLGLFEHSNEEKQAQNEMYENPNEVKYSNPLRRLRAKAKFEDSYNSMLLGVPEDKESPTSRHNRIDYFNLILREVDTTDNIDLVVKSGTFFYFKGNPEISIEDEVYAEFGVTKEIFDCIEKWLLKSDIQLSVYINRKGWLWVGPINDKEMYFDKENNEKAEFSGITFTKIFTETESDNIAEDTYRDKQETAQDNSQQIIEATAQIFKKLNELDTNLSSIKLTAWIIALSLILGILF
ncbi:hypothetical protein [Thiomicrorhabdus sp. Kp2]|uniref:hypothetical protein n=1 Tax=Thiomicrorhabdus sp. Kp2 TaxID=1123518 RepID=UPI00041263CF|nr:hypothetical protein [Thiomicrorhabdus sp. Kp2]